MQPGSPLQFFRVIGGWPGATDVSLSVRSQIDATSFNPDFQSSPEIGTHIYQHGSQVSIQALTPFRWRSRDQFYIVTGWDATGSLSSGLGTDTGPFTLTEDTSITWFWEPTIPVTVGRNARGATPAPGRYTPTAGSPITLQATPLPGYRFVEWAWAPYDPLFGSTLQTLSNDPNLTITLFSNGGESHYVEPLFEPLPGVCLDSRFDWNKDLSRDLMFQHEDGRVAVWEMDAGEVSQTLVLDTVQTNANRKIVGHTDFYNNGREDILWQEPDGSLSIWYMDGTQFIRENRLYTPASPDWRIVATEDVNSDGRDEWIFQNESSGQCAVWYIRPGFDSGIFQSLVTLPSPPGLDWRLKAVKDMSGDGEPEVVWRNRSTGQISIWCLSFGDDIQFQSQKVAPAPASTDWDLRSVHDVDGDCLPDFVFRNQVTGAIEAWFLSDTISSNGRLHLGGTSPLWKIRHSGD